MAHQPLIWVLVDDRPGNGAQALGVAESLRRSFVIKHVRYTALARIPNILTGASALGLTPESRAIMTPPWPDLVIAAGRRTAPVARWIRRTALQHGASSPLLVQLMYPGRRGAGDFDLIVAPRHDCERSGGDPVNVLRITGAVHRLDAARLGEAANNWAGRLIQLPRPFIALVVGGATHRKPFPGALAEELGRSVQRMAAAAGGSVLLATSRRTGEVAERALLAAVAAPRHTFLWGQSGGSAGGENPYLGYLALADAIVVTGDSVSMCSEACAMSGPVYIYAPEGMVAPKHARFHRELYDLGAARPFEQTMSAGRFEAWRHPPLNPAGEAVAAIDDLLRRRFTAE